MEEEISELYEYPKPPKRRRLERNEKLSSYVQNIKNSFQSNATIDHVPPEIMFKLFSYMPTNYLVTSMRMISHKFKNNIDDYMKKKFYQLLPRTLKIQQKINSELLESNKSKSRKLFKMLQCIECLMHSLKLTEAAVWRYLKEERNNFHFCKCASKFFDAFDNFFILVNEKSKETISKNSPSFLQLHKLIKNYLFHFERVWEPLYNKTCFDSGAKICDILDCCFYAKRKIIEQQIDNKMCQLKISYFLNNSWFTALPVTPKLNQKKVISWTEQQRLMYLRLRRLVLAHTVLSMDIDHWERSKYVLTPETVAIRPQSSIYCGFGEYDRHLYYYGSFNEGALEFKIRRMEFRALKPEDIKQQNLEITVNVSCPLEQAPLFIYKRYCSNIDQKYSKKNQSRITRLQKAAFNLTLEFNSKFTEKTKLATHYMFIVSEENRLNFMFQKMKES